MYVLTYLLCLSCILLLSLTLSVIRWSIHRVSPCLYHNSVIYISHCKQLVHTHWRWLIVKSKHVCIKKVCRIFQMPYYFRADQIIWFQNTQKSWGQTVNKPHCTFSERSSLYHRNNVQLITLIFQKTFNLQDIVNMQCYSFCNLIRNWRKYANKGENVNKYLPIRKLIDWFS